MGNNLPPDVTPADIDEAFGPPDMVRVHGTVSVAVSVEVPESYGTEERRQALLDAAMDGDYDQVLHAEVEEVHRL